MNAKNLLREMISIPSITGDEKKLSHYVADVLKIFCNSVEIDDMNNVVGIMKANSPGPTIMLTAHLDCVSPGDMKDPFSAKILSGAEWGLNGDVIYGRGASDDKSGIAALICAAWELSNLKNDICRILLVFVAKEEYGGGLGTIEALKKLGASKDNVDIAILAEPTNMRIYHYHRGKVEFQLKTIGKSAHASNPSNGINALELMSAFFERWKNVPLPSDTIMGKCTSAVTNLVCSDPGKTAVIPNSAVAYFDRRYLPRETPESVKNELLSVLNNIKSCDKNFNYELNIVYVMPPFFIPKENTYLKLFKKTVTEHLPTVEIGGWCAGTDASFIQSNFGIPVIGFGPGIEELAHTNREIIAIRDLELSVRIYKDFILKAQDAKEIN